MPLVNTRITIGGFRSKKKTYFLIPFFHYLTRLLFLHSALSPCVFSSLSPPPLNRFDRQTVEEFLFPPPSLFFFSNSDISPLLFSPSFDSSCGNYQGGFLPPLNHPSSLQRAVGKGGCRSNPTFFFGVGGGRGERVGGGKRRGNRGRSEEKCNCLTLRLAAVGGESQRRRRREEERKLLSQLAVAAPENILCKAPPPPFLTHSWGYVSSQGFEYGFGGKGCRESSFHPVVAVRSSGSWRRRIPLEVALH